jgi:hypothetical protein
MEMKNRNAGLGVFLISIGVIWVLINLGIINFSIFDSLQVLWPLVLVVIGVTVIFRENTLIKTVAWLLFLAVIIFYGSTVGNKAALKNKPENKRITIEKHEKTKFGELNLMLGGVNLNFDSKTNNLLESDIGTIDSTDIKNAVNYRNDKETAVINFTRKPKFTLKPAFNNSNAEFHLHEDVIWDMDIKVGAVSGTIDMSRIKLRNFDIDAGASRLNLIFGNNHEEAEIKINAGASNINLSVPEGVGVRIKIDGLVSRENLDNLGWKRQDKYYFSPNYFNSKNKINIDIKLGVGKLSVDVIK